MCRNNFFQYITSFAFFVWLCSLEYEIQTNEKKKNTTKQTKNIHKNPAKIYKEKLDITLTVSKCTKYKVIFRWV